MRELDTYLAITNKTILQDARYTHGRDTDPRTNCPSHMFSANLRLAWFHANVHCEWNGRTGWQGGREREREESRGGLFKKLIIPLGWINVRVVRARSCKRGYRHRFVLSHRIHISQFVTNPRPWNAENDFFWKNPRCHNWSLGVYSVLLTQTIATQATTWWTFATQASGTRTRYQWNDWIRVHPIDFFSLGVWNGIDANYTSERNFPSSSICRVQIQLEGGVCMRSARNYTNYQHLVYQREDSEQFCWVRFEELYTVHCTMILFRRTGWPFRY